MTKVLLDETSKRGVQSSPIADYSVMAQGFNGRIPIECYIYVLADNSKFDFTKRTCLLDSIGCVTFLTLTSYGWSHKMPPAPFQENVCLSKHTSHSVKVGECICKENFCQCYCIGSLCNTKYGILFCF